VTQIPTPDFSRSSFPYLRVAQFYEVSYAGVLRLAESLDENWSMSFELMDKKWAVATHRAWQSERQRRMLA